MHALLVQRPGIDDLLLANPPKSWVFGAVVLVGRPAVDDPACAELLFVVLQAASVGLGEVLVVALLVLLRHVQVIEVAEELVEAMIGRQVLVAVAQMALSEVPGTVPGVLQHFGQARRGRLQTQRIARLAHGDHARTDRILAGDESRASCGTGLLRVVVGEAYALVADGIDVGRGVAHRPHPVGTHILPPDVIAPDDEDIGTLRFFGRRHGGFSR
ncbi:hypothetical protein D3C71_1429730 [compost metagenome]